MFVPSDPNYQPPPPVRLAHNCFMFNSRSSDLEDQEDALVSLTDCQGGCRTPDVQNKDDLKPIKSDSGSRHPEAGRLPTKPARLSREAKIYLCPESSGLISAFIRLPLETLGEILCSLPTPKDLLAVARTCKTLCKILIHPDAAYIWRRLRNKVGLPDPLKFNSELSSETNEVLGWVEGIGLFVGKESAYAAFVFDGGVCEHCGKDTEEMYASYSLRVRLCQRGSCWKQFQSCRLLNGFGTQTLHPDPFEEYVWWSVPTLETLEMTPKVERFSTGKTTRNSLPDIMRDQLNLEEEGPRLAKLALSCRKRYLDGKPITISLTDASLRTLSMAVARNNAWMDFSTALLHWQVEWLRIFHRMKGHNVEMGKVLADEEKWEYSDLMNNSSFGRFFQTKSLYWEMITRTDINRFRPIVAQELHGLRERQKRSTIKRLREENFDQVWKYYQKLRSHEEEYPILPSFPVFLTLPAVQLLRSPNLAEAQISVKAAVSENGHENGLLRGLLEQQLASWEEKVKLEMLQTLDPSGSLMRTWKTRVPTSRVPHPVCRLDALWKCKECHSVESSYAASECLDFRGICLHQCKERDGKKKKKRKGESGQVWSVDNFVKDEQACAVMESCLKQLDKGAQIIEQQLFVMDRTAWICTSCNPPLLVHSRNLPGHSHRHAEQTNIERLPYPSVYESLWARVPPYGLAQWLVLNSRDVATRWILMRNYMCSHCLNPQIIDLVRVAQRQVMSDENYRRMHEEVWSGIHKYDFNGLRSHLKAKHEVYAVGDEDFYGVRDVEDYARLPMKHGLFRKFQPHCELVQMPLWR